VSDVPTPLRAALRLDPAAFDPEDQVPEPPSEPALTEADRSELALAPVQTTEMGYAQAKKGRGVRGGQDAIARELNR
jgi:hypothetical protein